MYHTLLLGNSEKKYETKRDMLCFEKFRFLAKNGISKCDQ